MKNGKEEVIQVFDTIASKTSWERLYSGEIDRISYNFVTRQRAVEELLSPYTVEKVLDVGCGTGDMAAFFIKRGASYTGIDLSCSMIERAISNYAILVAQGRVSFQVADCEKLPFNDGEFDALSAVALVEYLYDPSRALDEILRVIKNGGYVVITVPNKKCINNWFRALFKPLTYILFPIYVRIKKAPLASMRKVKHYSYSQREIDALMENRGFKKIDYRYTNFHIVAHPFDHLIPRIYMKISDAITRRGLDKAYKNWASNYIAVYKRNTS